MSSVHTIRNVPGRYVFGCRIAYLPDLTSDVARFGGIGHPIIEGYARQQAFLRALTVHGSGTCALQLRFVSHENTPDPIDVLILGAAQGLEQAYELLDMIQNLMPSEVPIEVVQSEHELEELWFPFRSEVEFTARTFAEIRRAIEPLDPTPDAPRGGPYDLALLDWAWSAHSLTNSLELMRQQQGTTLLGVSVMPTSVHHEVYKYLTEGVTHFQTQLRSEWENPLVQTARNVYFDRARRLRQAALQLRVFLGSDKPLMAGAPEFFGADLSRRSDSNGLRPQAFEVVRPRTDAESGMAKSMIELLESPIWGCPEDADENLQELTFLVDPLEAHTAFRIPLTPAGGLAGIATSRISNLGRGRQVRLASNPGGQSVVVGESPSTGALELMLRDVNEHILVAGVPGSGKSTTVRNILRGIHALDIPFLVLDPAKADYTGLADLAEVIEFSPDRVGFNPLAVPVNCSVRAHQTRVLAALDQGLRLSEQWPLGRIVAGLALSATYEAAGVPEIATEAADWPSLADLYRHSRAVIREQGFVGQAKSDVSAALLSRIEFMLEGTIGDVLSGDSSQRMDWTALTASSAVLHMRQVSGPDERALVFGLLLAGLVGFREANPCVREDRAGLGHVTVLEEAHRLLSNSSGSSYSSNLFADAIAELRGSGEGFIVVDQAPSLLIPGVSKNAGTRIAHRLTDSAEREFVGGSMLLSKAQVEDMARLAQGRAIVQTGSMSEPVLATMFAPIVGAGETRRSDSRRSALASEAKPVKPWCHQCPRPCEAVPLTSEVQLVSEVLPDGEDVAAYSGYITSAAEALRLEVPLKGPREAMKLYCVSAKALSDSIGSDRRRRSSALRSHRQAFEDVALAGRRDD